MDEHVRFVSRPRRILVVERDGDVAETIAELLRASGYRVVIARDLDGAASCSSVEDFALALIDAQLEQVRGGLPAQLASLELIRTLASTSGADPPRGRMLSKPFGRSELLRAVDAVLTRPPAGSRSGRP